MKITLVSAGSRGDIAPFAILAAALQGAGHDATLLAHEEFVSLVGTSGVRFLPSRGDNPRDILDSINGRRLLANAKSPRSYAREFRKLVEPAIEPAFEDTRDAAEGADLLIYSPVAFGGFNVAEKLRIPSLQLQLQPLLPSYRYPTVFSPTRTLGPVGNRLSHEIAERTLSDGIREPMNRARKNVLGLPPRDGRNLIREQRAHEALPLLAFDAELLPPPPQWATGGVQCGALLATPSAGATLPAPIEAFLAQDGPCISIGLGSMVVEEPAALVDAIARVTERLGLRAIVQRGWGGLEPTIPSPQLLFIDEVDHGLLFPRVDGIVHHGGAGTTARAVRSGKPSLVVPLMGDQFFFGHRTADRGVGPKALPFDDVTEARLATRLNALVNDVTFLANARALAASINARDQVGVAVGHVEAVLDQQGSRKASTLAG